MSSILTLHHPARAAEYYARGFWRGETLYDLLRRHAAERPTHVALRDARVRLTWRELADWVDAFAEDLHAAGLRPGSRVAVWLPNRAETIVATLACSRMGYVCNPSLHQSYSVAEVAALAARIECEAFVGQPGFGAGVQGEAFTAMGALACAPRRYRVAVGAPGAPLAGRDTALPAGCTPFPAPRRVAGAPPRADPDRVVLLAFTSGTTGEPKGVMHSDNTLLANARAMAADWRHREDMVLYSMSPLTHAIGTIAMAQSLVSGFELVVNDLPAGVKPLDWIVQTGATYVMGVPTHAIDLLAELRRRGERRLGKVEVFYMGGAAIPRETVVALIELGIRPQNVYGMTENGAHQYTLPDDPLETVVATCGRAAAGYEVRIVDPEHPDRELPAGSIGEIAGRGANLMLGYFDNQAATERSFNREGWFLSGDLGVLDARGCLAIVGRRKDIIIRGGRNIHPARIEDLARAHAAVLKSAAFPVADARLGEKVCLALILQDNARLEADEMLAHLAARGLAKADMPEYFIVLDAFPLTPSGKILKRELVEWASGGRIRPQPCRYGG